jgi:hypothetical protein
MKFSKQLFKKAIVSVHDELAWKKEDVFQAIDELIDNNIALLGGDVWAVMKYDENTPILTWIDHNRIAVGIIKGKDGQDYVYNWSSDKRQKESWNEFVRRSKSESIEVINKLDVERTVSVEYADSIYYNLVFVDQFEYKKLKKK